MPDDSPSDSQDRVRITYPQMTSDGVVVDSELPLKMLFVGDYTGSDSREAGGGPRPEDRGPIKVDRGNLAHVLAAHEPELTLPVADPLSGDPAALRPVTLRFRSLADFGPDAVATQAPPLRRMLDLRDALTALKGPRGDLAAFRKRLAMIFPDAAERARILASLGLGD
jgi:type VI secretion system protein ImpB